MNNDDNEEGTFPYGQLQGENMRTLCLNLSPIEQACAAEAFLVLSPRVQFRLPHFVFIDLESTAGLLGGEDRALIRAVDIAKALGAKNPQAGIADHPALAQILAVSGTSFISPPREDAATLRGLPLSVLTELEGLTPWPRRRRIEHIIEFFESLGLRGIDGIWDLSLSSFRERWGETGVTLWKRLHGQEGQVLSPLLPTEGFQAYAYFDDPVGLLPFLRSRLDELLRFLFLRLEGQGRFARKLELILHCEYSDARHRIAVEPVSPNRDLRLFQDLLFAKVEKVDLLNPVRECEVHLDDVPEKIEQMDFFEPRDSSEDRWQRLISFAQQAQIEVGFLELVPQHFPENSYQLKPDWPRLLEAQDHIERDEDAIQVKSVYAKALLNTPRPTLLLETPKSLTTTELRRFRKLSFFPTERLEASWWARLRDALKKEGRGVMDRDYYFAVSDAGELVWIYQDRDSKNYYLHGYFD